MIDSVIPDSLRGGVAIVNLSNARLRPFDAIAELKSRSCVVVAHAGHKEKELLSAAKEAGCDLVVSNSEIVNKLEAVLESVEHA
jgi:hypothetical protein